MIGLLRWTMALGCGGAETEDSGLLVGTFEDGVGHPRPLLCERWSRITTSRSTSWVARSP